jgi:hypothetical protein
MELHLPYYAWRRMPPIRHDLNAGRRVDGKSICRSEEVIPLQMKGEQPHEEEDGRIDYIHEAQISIMITGIDDWFWTAYCFVDVYFKEEGHTESVQHYTESSPPMDPHSCGKDSVNRPIWRPRHYFLRTLSCRIEQAKQEWNNSIFQLFRQIEPCVRLISAPTRGYILMLIFAKIYSFTRGVAQLGEGGELEITQQKGFKWTIRILRQFTHLLSKTIDSWETFKDGEIRYFNLSEAQADWGRYLAAIDKDVTELRDLRSSLLHITQKLMISRICYYTVHNYPCSLSAYHPRHRRDHHCPRHTFTRVY